MTRNDGSVGVIGLGYVGLPLALAMADAGFDVIGIDIDKNRIEMVRRGESYLSDVTDKEIQSGLDNGLTASTNYDDLESVSCISICVPTPLRKTGNPDLSNVIDAVDRLANVISPGTTVILESTVYPGATDELVVPTLAENGWSVGEDVFVAFSPERIDPGNEEFGPTEIPKILGGVTETCGERALGFYEQVFDEVVMVDSATEAEMVKLLENSYRAINIGMTNEMAQISHRLKVDIWNVVEAASTKPFGFEPFYPGPGLGGHCIPVDPMYLSWKANEQGAETHFIDLADRINRSMPEHVVQRITWMLNDEGIAVSNSEVLVLGVTYKPNVSDTRESPAADIISGLSQHGAEIAYHDPHVAKYEVDGVTYESVNWDSSLDEYDLVVVVTDHDEYDYDEIANAAKLVFDTRGAMDRSNDNVVAL